MRHSFQFSSRFLFCFALPYDINCISFNMAFFFYLLLFIVLVWKTCPHPHWYHVFRSFSECYGQLICEILISIYPIDKDVFNMNLSQPFLSPAAYKCSPLIGMNRYALLWVLLTRDSFTGIKRKVSNVIHTGMWVIRLIIKAYFSCCFHFIVFTIFIIFILLATFHLISFEMML